MAHGEITREASKFLAHHQAQGKLMASWPAAWRTWCLNFEAWQKEKAAAAKPERPKELWELQGFGAPGFA